MTSLLFLLLSGFAYADDNKSEDSSKPKFVQLEEGEQAPFSGRLLNDAAIIKIGIQDKFKVEQCQIEIDYQASKLKSVHNLELQKQTIDLTTDIKILESKVNLRDERIQALEKANKPSDKVWMMALGYVVGAGTTIAVLYAVY